MELNVVKLGSATLPAAPTPPVVCTALPGLASLTYPRHALHDAQCLWVEKNCYADLWIEIIHAKGYEPQAMLPFTVSVDFEGDQWTFFKPSHDELRSLYGIKVHELTVWRPLLDHAMEHLSAGRLVSIEVDAFWLPDTHGTDYQTKHSKTTIAINHVDAVRQEIAYFHNAGYFLARGEDFRQLLKIDATVPELPLFAELISFNAQPLHNPAQRRQASLALMDKQLQCIPSDNPIDKFANRFAVDLPWLQAQGLAHYHAWAFAGIRQWGAAHELTAAWIDWMGNSLPPESQEVSALFRDLSQDAKTLILKGARAVMSKKPFDPQTQLLPAAEKWQRATELLTALVKSA